MPKVNRPKKNGPKPKAETLVEKLKRQTELLTNPKHLNVTSWALIVLELFITIAVVQKVNYTEIDWKAYMQEVEGFMNGTYDYKLLKGDTGPLVYPAGFVYIYSVFYKLTSNGTNILLAQYLFILIYLGQLFLSFSIYRKTAKVAPYALIICTLTSYRIHSIYILRLFNDTIAVLLFYGSLNVFLSNRWILGSILYSLAVSVKMNILLYAPCLLLAYLTNLTIKDTIMNLAVCGFVQLVLGLPFLLENPVNYLMGSFDIGRIFEYKWTVNYRFLSREMFESREFHIGLLVLHATLLLLFLPLFKRYMSSYAKLKCVTSDIQKEKNLNHQVNFNTGAQLFVLPFFVTNLIGMACARSLHYQFYCWYFHSLLYLAYCSGYRKSLMFLLLGVIEFCWNVYPSTIFSSAALHVCHGFMLYGVYKYMKQ